MPRNTMKYSCLLIFVMIAACGDNSTKKTADLDVGMTQDAAADATPQIDMGADLSTPQSDPKIVSMTVEPNSIAATSTGMNDKSVSVTLVVSGFAKPIEADQTVVSIEESGTILVFENAILAGNTITLTEISLTAFQGLEPGEYSLAARVLSSDEQVYQLALATITITP